MKKILLSIAVLSTIAMACPEGEICKATNFEENKSKYSKLLEEVFSCVKDSKNGIELKKCKKEIREKINIEAEPV